MENYIISLFEAFGNYIDMVTKSTQWWLIPAVLGAIWLISIVFTKFINESSILTREFKILTYTILISICVEFVLLSWFIYNWLQTEIYQIDIEKLVHVVSIIVCIIPQVIGYKILANGFEREKILQNINCPVTKGDLNYKNKIAVKEFKKIKIWALLPVISFLILFLPIKQDKSLVSFLLDTSSSMDIHIANGQEILEKSFQSVDNDTDIILSWFSENDPTEDFAKLINTKDRTKLGGVHQYFTNKKSAIKALNTIEFTKETPLYETIWSNYLYTTEISQNKEYVDNIFVLVTDGEDSYLKDATRSFLCEIPQFNEFYQDNINIINLQGLDNTFFDKANECNYIVYEGMDIDSYSTAVKEILGEVTRDYYFPVWLFIFCTLGILIIVFIKPKKY